MASTVVSDIIVPEEFSLYVQQLTEEKSRIIQSGALVRQSQLDEFLSGGGVTFNVPSFQDLGNVDDLVSDDTPTPAVPENIDTSQEVAVRLSRNQSWGSADLVAALAGADPMDVAANRVSTYWARRLQSATIATVGGISKDNSANDSEDYAFDIAAGAFSAGVTDFNATAYINAALTMGDSSDNLSMVMMHSVVHAKAQQNDLITFIRESESNALIPTFRGAVVIVDDGLPSGVNSVRGDGTAGVAGVYETWLFGPGALHLGVGSPKVPVEIQREALQGNGGGQETLTSRVEWIVHPMGHAYVGTSPNGGPSNAATANNLNDAASWNRVFPERKQIPFARLITRES